MWPLLQGVIAMPFTRRPPLETELIAIQSWTLRLENCELNKRLFLEESVFGVFCYRRKEGL